MKNLFCSTIAKNDEEYIAFLKRRIFMFVILGVLGMASIATILYLSHEYEKDIHDFTEGFFLGVGSGLFIASIVLIIRLIRILKNEKLRRKTRIEIIDERNIQINTEATKVATFVSFIGMYIAIFVSAVIEPVFSIILAAIVFSVALAYIIAYKVISKKI